MEKEREREREMGSGGEVHVGYLPKYPDPIPGPLLTQCTNPANPNTRHKSTILEPTVQGRRAMS